MKFDEIVASVFEIIETGEKHVQERPEKGEEESAALSNESIIDILICETEATRSKTSQ